MGETPARTRAYESLLWRMVCAEPIRGYRQESQLPDLSTTDLLTVLEQNPSVMLDAATERLADSLVKLLRDKRGTDLQPYAGELLLTALGVAIRTHLYAQTQAEIARLEREDTDLAYEPDDRELRSADQMTADQVCISLCSEL